MLTTFQKTLLGTIAGAAVLLSLVIAAKGATPTGSFAAGGGTSALALPIQNGGVVPGILTTGDATVHVKPDLAIITVGAVAQGSTAAEAQSAIASRVDQILKRAKDLGIADADTKTAGYSIQPQYATGTDKAPRIAGYQASQQITLSLHNVDATGKALDALIQGDTAGNTVSVRLTLNDPKTAQADARRQAIADAKAKATAMASAAGVSLGRAISISDIAVATPAVGRDAFQVVAAPAPSTQVPTGDLDVVVRVQVQFEIQ